MGKVFKLTVAFLTEHPVRVVLTTIATMAATCMVVWNASGYDALQKSFDDYANVALGRYPLAIAPIALEEPQPISPAMVEKLRADPQVAVADPMWAVRTPLQRGDSTADQPRSLTSPAPGPPGRRQDPLVLATDSAEPPFELSEGRWIETRPPGTQEVVVRADVADRLQLKVGDELLAGNSLNGVRLTVVGRIGLPSLNVPPGMQILTPSSAEFYVPIKTAEAIHSRTAEISLIGIGLAAEVDITRFRFGWSPRLSRFDTPVQFQEAHEIEEALDQSAAARNVELQAYAATGVAMLVALLVVFCALSMGVTERTRQLAVLRAIVLTKGQVLQLVFLESLFLAVLGLTGGLLVSVVLLRVTSSAAAHVLKYGAVLGSTSLLLSVVAVLGGALLAAVIPAIRATRVRPVDAMSPRPQLATSQALRPSLLLTGLALVAVNPLLAFVFPPQFEDRVIACMAIGFACMAAGFVLLAPFVVVLVDRWFSPVLARLLGVSPKLLASQLTSHLWRTAGAAVSLSVGMGLYIGVQVWGFTMLEAFIPGPWAPDALIAFRPHGIDPAAAGEVARFPGVDPERCLPLVVEQPRLLGDLTHSSERASVTRQDNVVIVGMDALKTFGGEHPLLTVEWVAGSPSEAIAALQSGRGCVVPDHFLTEANLKLGDSFALIPPRNSEQPVTYTIAGAIKLPGWHWQTKTTGFRPRTHRAAAIVFADDQQVTSDFQMPTATHMWFWYDRKGADLEQLGQSAQALYAAQLQEPVSIGAPPEEGGASVQVLPVEGIRAQTRRAARHWIWLLSQVPLVAMIITAFGVLNVMLASVRARRWEMGVLRSLGFTRATIIRTIIAEGLLIGVVAGCLSFSFGLLSGWCGAGFAQYISFFGGLHPELIVPWLPIGIGLAMLVSLAGATAIWPAVDIGRTRPLTLLQRGRSAF